MAERTEVDTERAETRRPGRGAAYGLTRALTTLIAAAAAGLLIWFATQISDSSNGGYWAQYGLIAAAGLIMALSQILGGWTKWGRPRLSLNVFLWAFVPVAIAALWVTIFHQPSGGWFRDHIRSWSNDIGIDGLVRDFKEFLPVLTFGLGLVLGYAFDTTGPAVEQRGWRRRRERVDAAEPATATGARAYDGTTDRDIDRERAAYPDRAYDGTTGRDVDRDRMVERDRTRGELDSDRDIDRDRMVERDRTRGEIDSDRDIYRDRTVDRDRTGAEIDRDRALERDRGAADAPVTRDVDADAPPTTREGEVVERRETERL